MKKTLTTFIIASTIFFTLSSYSNPLNSYKIEQKITSNPNFKNIIKNVEKKYSDAKKNYINADYNSALKNINQAKSDVVNIRNNKNHKQELLKNFYSHIKSAQLNLMYSRPVESRGIYLDVDTIPTTKKDISDLIKKIKEANFNIIYPEVFRRGYAIFPNKIAQIDDKFKKVDFDVFEYITQEAHKNNIEVYPWIWTFRVKSPLWGDSFLKRYPDLVARREKYRFEDREPLFLSPSDPRARALILSLIKKIIVDYKIDGMLLDYIRYDETLPDDILTMQNFRKYYFEKHKKNPPNKIVQGDFEFLELQLWRENQITEMVKNVKKLFATNRPKAKLGVAVFRNEQQTRLLKMQDWRYWANNKYIDFVCPMLYTDNTKELNDWIDIESDDDTRKDFLYPSLGALRFNSNDDFYPLVGLLHKRNVTGLNIFALSHFGTNTMGELAKGVFRKPALIPDKSLEKSIKEILKDNNDWLRKIKKEEVNLAYKLNNILYELEQLPFSYSNKNLFKKTINNIDKQNIPQSLKENITNNLEYCIKIIKIYEVRSLTKSFKQTIPPFLKFLEDARYIPPAKFLKVGSRPIIDGDLEYKFWDNIEPISNFYSYTGTSKPEVETIVKTTYSKENIYISFENFEDEQVNNINNDYVEIYFYNKSNKKTYCFQIDSKNNKTYFENNYKKGSFFWKAGVKKLNGKWLVEIEIPLKALDIQDFKDISGNFLRNREHEIINKSLWYPDYNQKDNRLGFGKFNFLK